jgi:sulfur dioxygenase
MSWSGVYINASKGHGLVLYLHACCPDCSGLGVYRQLYKSVHTQLFSLPDSTIVYPAHDYKGRTSSTILSEKTSNPRLGLSEDKFVELMQNLGLPYPKKIDVAVPANLACGVY